MIPCISCKLESLCQHMKSLLTYLASTGLLPSVRHGKSMRFALTAAALMWMYRVGPLQVTTHHQFTQYD